MRSTALERIEFHWNGKVETVKSDVNAPIIGTSGTRKDGSSGAIPTEREDGAKEIIHLPCLGPDPIKSGWSLALRDKLAASFVSESAT